MDIHVEGTAEPDGKLTQIGQANLNADTINIESPNVNLSGEALERLVEQLRRPGPSFGGIQVPTEPPVVTHWQGRVEQLSDSIAHLRQHPIVGHWSLKEVSHASPSVRAFLTT